MNTIGLIGCSKHKLGQDNPTRKYRAQDIYQGNTFKISKTIGIKKFHCDDWHILSANYDLLNKDDEIEYYDMYLGHQSSAYKKQWAQNVISKLQQKYDLAEDVFYIFAGSDYYRDLLPYLHCFVFNYKSCNTINLEEPVEYVYGVRK